jgi:tRNA (guanine-N7-)-methyltransferase
MTLRSAPCGRRFLRVRQHANPLASHFYEPPEGHTWSIFKNPDAPLHLDIGCGNGSLLVDLAAAHPDRNHLGIDVRSAVVDLARKRLATAGSTAGNCHFLVANLELSHRHWLPYPGRGGISIVTIFHPDPLVKQSQRKRRVLTPALAELLAGYTVPGVTRLHIQSDVQEAFDSMAFVLDDPEWAQRWWARDSPDPTVGPFAPLMSAREQFTLQQHARLRAEAAAATAAPVAQSKEAHRSTSGAAARQPSPLPKAVGSGRGSAAAHEEGSRARSSGSSNALRILSPAPEGTQLIWRASYTRTVTPA